MFKCSCGYETDKGNSFSAHYRHSNGEGHKRLGWVDPVSGAVSPTRPRGKKPNGSPPKAVSPPKTETPKVVTGEVPLAAIATIGAAPILFTIGQQKIPMNPEHLYDAWRYYDDIKRIDPSIDDEFTLAIKVAMKYIWEIYSHQEAAKVGVTIETEKE